MNDELSQRIAVANWAFGVLPSDAFDGAYLDVGFGSGNALIAAALKGCRDITGIDPDFEQRSQGQGASAPPFRDFWAVVAETGARQAAIKLVDGDIRGHDFQGKHFDLVSLLDVVEHLPEPEICLRKCAELLSPGGRLLIAVSPLFYSQVGHHLWSWWPADSRPWRHLYHDFAPKEQDRIRREESVPDWYWAEFERLNRITGREIRSFCTAAGLVEESYLPLTGGADKIAAHAHLIDHSRLPSLEDLFLEGIVMVCRRLG